LKEKWRDYLVTLDPVPDLGTPPVPEMRTYLPEVGTPPVPDLGTHKQTSYKQTSYKQTEWDDIWSSVLESLRGQLPQSTYYSFVEPTRLTELCNGVATITLPDIKAKE